MGSRKGRPNRLTASVRDRIEQAFNVVNGEGNSGLIRLAEENPAIFYGLVAKLVPVQASLAVSVVALDLGQEMLRASESLARLQKEADMKTIQHIDVTRDTVTPLNANPLKTKET